MTVVASHNLNYSRGWRAHRRDIRRVLRVAEIAAWQELRRPLREPLAWLVRVVQPRRSPVEVGGEGITVRRRSAVRVLKRGSKVASRRRFGMRIGARRLVWVLVDLPDGATPTLIVDYHRVPLRMQPSRIDEAQDARLRELILWAISEGWEWIVLGDMNQLERADPAGLRYAFRATWVGSRIDLAAVSPGLRVVRWWEDQDPQRKDNHPVLYVEVKEK